ncbi:hypothetical protein [uncultured Prevotella sp.]|nr:hypothetical protein [uncultured Prevotella sp.]
MDTPTKFLLSHENLRRFDVKAMLVDMFLRLWSQRQPASAKL